MSKKDVRDNPVKDEKEFISPEALKYAKKLKAEQNNKKKKANKK